jgi:hypothetical protein
VILPVPVPTPVPTFPIAKWVESITRVTVLVETFPSVVKPVIEILFPTERPCGTEDV